jgi:hypothetical protein
MSWRFGRSVRHRDASEQRAIGALLSALVAVEQARGALESVRGRFGRTKRTEHQERRAYSNAVRWGIGALVLLTIISLVFWLLRRKSSEETAPASVSPEEGVEEAAPPEEEEVPPGSSRAEDVFPREAPPPGEERPEGRGATPPAP